MFIVTEYAALSRGDFKPLNEGVQTDKRQITKRAVSQTAKNTRVIPQ